MMETKNHILQEIKRLAAENNGKAPGAQRFERETGIRRSDWYPHLWLRWGDAVAEAGFERNELVKATDEQFLLEKLALRTRQLEQVPIEGHLRRAAKQDSAFPSADTFRRCLGSRENRVSRVIAFCEEHPEFEDVAALWRQVPTVEPTVKSLEADDASTSVGYVYLLKHGSRREYKIGRTNNPLRREGELGIQLPEKCEPVHYIQTDDPEGVESYWHRRFANKRKEGEWFALTPQEVRSFKRWRRIY
jgi:hypothetical protein